MKRMTMLYSVLVIMLINITFSQAELTTKKTDKELENKCYSLVKEKLSFLEQPIFQGTTKSSYKTGYLLLSLSFVSRNDAGQHNFWLGNCEVEDKVITSIEIIDMN